MTVEEKALSLVNKFSAVGLQQRGEGIACALIAVEEILTEIDFLHYIDRVYWQQVKQEIENL